MNIKIEFELPKEYLEDVINTPIEVIVDSNVFYCLVNTEFEIEVFNDEKCKYPSDNYYKSKLKSLNSSGLETDNEKLIYNAIEKIVIAKIEVIKFIKNKIADKIKSNFSFKEILNQMKINEKI